VAGVAVAMVSVHLESHDDPAARAGDMAHILAQVDLVAQGGPVILGGDFNTSTGSHAERHDAPEDWRARIESNPMRLLRPMAHEPLFALAAEQGYDWQACNVAGAPTTRYPEGSTRLPAKIDWFFSRGLLATDPEVLPALCPDGTPSSDHEGLIVTVRALR
jgi:endonuclease/exonuclease/phosphatase (EEP) superfamily protein YafD